MNCENASAFEDVTAFCIYAGGPAPNEAHSTKYSNMSFCNTTACCGSRESGRRMLSFVFVYDPSDTVSCCSSLYLVRPYNSGLGDYAWPEAACPRAAWV